VSGNQTSLGGWSMTGKSLQGAGDSLDAVRVVAVSSWNGQCTSAEALAALVEIGLDVRNPPIGH